MSINLSYSMRSFFKLYLSFVVMISAGFPCSAENMASLPIDVEANVVRDGGKDILIIKIINISSGDIIVPKDLLETASWDVWALEENNTSGEFNLRQLIPQIREMGGKLSIQAQLTLIRQRLENAANLISLKAGTSFEVSIPLDNALNAAKLTPPLAFPIIAQLRFSNAILSSQTKNDAETVELFLTKFSTRRFILRDNKWIPFAQASSMQSKFPSN